MYKKAFDTSRADRTSQKRSQKLQIINGGTQEITQIITNLYTRRPKFNIKNLKAYRKFFFVTPGRATHQLHMPFPPPNFTTKFTNSWMIKNSSTIF